MSLDIFCLSIYYTQLEGYFPISNNFLSEILLISTEGPSQVLINRAAVFANIIEKYSNITGNVFLNKDKNIEFSLENGKNKLKLIIEDVTWATFKLNRKGSKGVLLNRTYLIPLFEELNGVDNEQKI